MVGYFLTWAFYIRLKLVPAKEQIINLNALIPSQNLYFPKHLLTSFECFSTKLCQKNSFKKKKKN
jgi:hypothetical protein